MDVITTRYETEKAAIRINGMVDHDSIIRLCDEMWLAAEYYQYRHIELQINSPGGSTEALEYYMNQLFLLRRKFGPRLIIGTVAMASVSSAAAVMLSLGTIGHRQAYQSSRILYHYARFESDEGDVWTRNRLESSSQLLAGIDAKMIGLIVTHIWQNKVLAERKAGPESDYRWTSLPILEPNPAAMTDGTVRRFMVGELRAEKGSYLLDSQLREAFHNLYAADYPISAEMAVSMLLIDEVIS